MVEEIQLMQHAAMEKEKTSCGSTANQYDNKKIKMLLNPHWILSLLSYNCYPFINIFFSLFLVSLFLSLVFSQSQAACLQWWLVSLSVGGWVGGGRVEYVCVFGVCVLGGGGGM